MIGQLVEIASWILVLILVVRVSVYIRRHSRQEDVMDLLGDALSLNGGKRSSNHDD
jgi:hypothetical protein